MAVMERHEVLASDFHGNIWLALSLVNVSPYPAAREPLSCRLVNPRTGKVTSFSTVDSCFQLTRREKEILFLISGGRVSKQISSQLNIIIHTVNTHRQNIIEKMDVSNTTEAVQMASRMGILV